MKYLLLGLVFAMFGTTALAQSTGIERASEALDRVQEAVDNASGAIDTGRDVRDDIESIANGTFVPPRENTAGMFNPDLIFPAWEDGGRVTGVIGSNGGALNQGDSRLIIYFIPKVIELMIWVVAPIVTFMFMYAGLQFIWGGDREEEIKKSRDMFRMAVVGLIFVVLSYSLMKAVFFIIV